MGNFITKTKVNEILTGTTLSGNDFATKSNIIDTGLADTSKLTNYGNNDFVQEQDVLKFPEKFIVKYICPVSIGQENSYMVPNIKTTSFPIGITELDLKLASDERIIKVAGIGNSNGAETIEITVQVPNSDSLIIANNGKEGAGILQMYGLISWCYFGYCKRFGVFSLHGEAFDSFIKDLKITTNKRVINIPKFTFLTV